MIKLRKQHKKPNLDKVEMEYKEKDKLGRVCLKKGTPHARIIGKGVDKTHEYVYHATKGWRKYSL